MKIKQISTGNNDSIEDVLISLMNVKTEDGKIVSMRDSWEIVKQLVDNTLLSSNPWGK